MQIELAAEMCLPDGQEVQLVAETEQVAQDESQALHLLSKELTKLFPVQLTQVLPVAESPIPVLQLRQLVAEVTQVLQLESQG